MGEDEAGTLAVLRAHREELIEPKIAEHEGRVVKLMGEVNHRGFDPTGKTLEEAYSGLDGDYCDGNYRYARTMSPVVQPTNPMSTTAVKLKRRMTQYPLRMERAVRVQ